MLVQASQSHQEERESKSHKLRNKMKSRTVKVMMVAQNRAQAMEMYQGGFYISLFVY